jgi:hypothetical protein
MLTSQLSAQESENFRAALFVIAVVIAVFWRELLRVLLALVVVAICAGVIMLLQSSRP